jgi:hypothetical protein
MLIWEIVTSGRLILERDPRIAEQFVRNARFAVEDELGRQQCVAVAGHPEPIAAAISTGPQLSGAAIECE